MIRAARGWTAAPVTDVDEARRADCGRQSPRSARRCSWPRAARRGSPQAPSRSAAPSRAPSISLALLAEASERAAGLLERARVGRPPVRACARGARRRGRLAVRASWASGSATLGAAGGRAAPRGVGGGRAAHARSRSRPPGSGASARRCSSAFPRAREAEPLPADEEATLAHKIERLERRREPLGAVNPLAQQEYEEAKGRHDETSEQIADLEGSLRELRRLIRDLTATITERFDETYGEVERNFAQVITTLFPGGRGRLRLVEPELRLAADGEEAEAAPEIAVASSEPGVELEVTPAGKQITRLAMLSGGEKALAAIAFLFAIMLARPCPFYVLDEVDAALDDANVERFLTLSTGT